MKLITKLRDFILYKFSRVSYDLNFFHRPFQSYGISKSDALRNKKKEIENKI